MNKVLESNRALDKIMSTIGDLPASPAVIATLMNLTSNINGDIKKISKAILADQSLTAKMLKLANSSFYGRTKEVTTLKEAIVVLGFMTLHSLVIATSTQSLYKKSIDDGVSAKLWEHALASGIASRMIAEAIGYPSVEEAFIAGLLHDIGKLVLAQKMTDDYCDIVKRVEETGDQFDKYEQSLFGFDHADVGAQLLHKWLFPEEIAEAVQYHHTPADANEQYSLLSHIVSMGDYMSKSLNIGSNNHCIDDPTSCPSMEKLNLDASRLQDLNEQLAVHFENEKELFRL
jgi:putative nucleotidyltransferase with HDIG domain